MVTYVYNDKKNQFQLFFVGKLSTNYNFENY